MAKLSDHEKSFIALLLRSKDVGDGWRNVSAPLWQLIELFSQKELLEVDEVERRARLSAKGHTVAEYLV